MGFLQNAQINALVKHQYIELKASQERKEDICSDDVQIEDVFDDEPVRFSVKENFASVVRNSEVKQDFPPIIMSVE